MSNIVVVGRINLDLALASHKGSHFTSGGDLRTELVAEEKEPAMDPESLRVEIGQLESPGFGLGHIDFQ